MRRILISAISAATVSLAAPSVGQDSPNNRSDCARNDGTLVTEQIDACTALIKSGDSLTSSQLALAYIYRGRGYDREEHYALARGDFDHAIAIGQEDDLKAIAYFYRGFTYDQEKDYAHAIHEYDLSITFDARNPDTLYNRGLDKNALGEAGGDADIARAKAIDPGIGDE